MKWLFTILLLLSVSVSSAQSGDFGVGSAAVYQRWKQAFDPAPMVTVGVNKTLFSFSATLTRGEGKKLNDLGGSDWNVTGRSFKTLSVGYCLKPEEDIDLWIVPTVGCSFVSDILQTNNGWVYGQPTYMPAFRIDVRYTYPKSGLGFWIGFGSIELGSIGITWRYKK